MFTRTYASNQQLVEALINRGVLKTPVIIDAFRALDRRDFVPDKLADQAYGDYPLEIGGGQTISQPTTVATMLELLQPAAGQKVLDVGSGSGWTSALLGTIVGQRGNVHATEIRQDLYKLGQDNLAKTGLTNVHTHHTPERLGWPQAAPYDRILVSAAAANVPDELLEQLQKPGTMVIPVQDSVVSLWQDDNGQLQRHEHYGYAFVPLIGKT